jgi:hypothetical protein
VDPTIFPRYQQPADRRIIMRLRNVRYHVDPDVSRSSAPGTDVHVGATRPTVTGSPSSGKITYTLRLPEMLFWDSWRTQGVRVKVSAGHPEHRDLDRIAILDEDRGSGIYIGKLSPSNVYPGKNKPDMR